MTDFSLVNKTIVITGASGHIGRALVYSLSAAGASVWALDKVEPDTTTKEKCSGVILCDLADSQDIDESITQWSDDIGEVHGIVHAAAFVGTSDLTGWLGPLEEQDRSTFDLAMDVNLGSVFSLVKKLQPQLKRPSIVFISSIYGVLGPDMALYDGTSMDNPAAYGASKAALQQFARYLATRYGRDGWRANSVVLGGVFRHQPGEFVKRYCLKTPLARMATEDDLKGVVQFLLSDASAYITGVELPVDGGYSIL